MPRGYDFLPTLVTSRVVGHPETERVLCQVEEKRAPPDISPPSKLSPVRKQLPGLLAITTLI